MKLFTRVLSGIPMTPRNFFTAATNSIYNSGGQGGKTMSNIFFPTSDVIFSTSDVVFSISNVVHGCMVKCNSDTLRM